MLFVVAVGSQAAGEEKSSPIIFYRSEPSVVVPFLITHVYLRLLFLFYLFDPSCQRFVYFIILFREWIFGFSSHPGVSFLFLLLLVLSFLLSALLCLP